MYGRVHKEKVPDWICLGFTFRIVVEFIVSTLSNRSHNMPTATDRKIGGRGFAVMEFRHPACRHRQPGG